jgi:hypothetical protein
MIACRLFKGGSLRIPLALDDRRCTAVRHDAAAPATIATTPEVIGSVTLWAALTGLDDPAAAAGIFNGKIAPYGDDFYDCRTLLGLCGVYGEAERRHAAIGIRVLRAIAIGCDQ